MTMLIMATLGILFAVSGAAIIYPFRPYRTRGNAALTILAVLVLIMYFAPQQRDEPAPVVKPSEKAIDAPEAAAKSWKTDIIQPEPPEPRVATIPQLVRSLISVPSDRRAQYAVIGKIIKKGARVVITTRRDGPSGRSFSRRECTCNKMLYRYLGDGETLAEALSDRVPADNLSPRVRGSISDHICRHGCRVVGER